MYVELKKYKQNFGDYKASDNVNFGVEKGKLIGLLGPSGSGKTTILRMIAGLETPDSGDIIIDGVRVNDLAASKRGIGFVFQNYALFRYMTVYDNIAFGLRVQKADKKKIDERVRELIKLIGLEGLEKALSEVSFRAVKDREWHSQERLHLIHSFYFLTNRLRRLTQK